MISEVCGRISKPILLGRPSRLHTVQLRCRGDTILCWTIIFCLSSLSSIASQPLQTKISIRKGLSLSEKEAHCIRALADSLGFFGVVDVDVGYCWHEGGDPTIIVSSTIHENDTARRIRSAYMWKRTWVKRRNYCFEYYGDTLLACGSIVSGPRSVGEFKQSVYRRKGLVAGFGIIGNVSYRSACAIMDAIMDRRYKGTERDVAELKTINLSTLSMVKNYTSDGISLIFGLGKGPKTSILVDFRDDTVAIKYISYPLN